MAVGVAKHAHVGEEVAHRDIACALRALGNVHYERNDCVDAEGYCAQALDMYRHLGVYGPGAVNADTARTHDRLGSVLLIAVTTEVWMSILEAMEVYQHPNVYGSGAHNESIAETLNNVGVVFHDHGDYQGAERF